MMPGATHRQVSPVVLRNHLFLNPQKPYSERLTKSIDGLWKRKEVFELGDTAQRPYPRECRHQLSSTKADPPLLFC